MSVMRLVGLVITVLLPACAGVSPLPDSLRVEDLEQRELSAAELQHLTAIIDRAINAVVRRQYDDAEVAAEQALAINPRAARAHAIVGMVMLQRAMVTDPPELFASHAAEARLRLAETLDAKDPFVGWMHAVLLAQLGHVSAAAETAERCLSFTSAGSIDERAALLGIAGTYRYELGEERAALPHLQSYVALRPDDSTAQFRLGVCLLRIAEVPQGPAPNSLRIAQRQAEGAAKAFAGCVKLAPGDEDADLAVGAALLRARAVAEQLGDASAKDLAQQADQHFRDVATKFPTSPEAPFRLGVLAEARHEPDAARGYYMQALDRDPKHVGSLLNLAGMFDAAGDRSAATALLERLMGDDASRSRLSDEERQRIVTRLRG